MSDSFVDKLFSQIIKKMIYKGKLFFVMIFLQVFPLNATPLVYTRREDSLQNIHSMTVITQISPFNLLHAYEAALKNELAKMGQVTQIKSIDLTKKKFCKAISNPILLKLYIESHIVEAQNFSSNEKSFKEEVRLILKVFREESIKKEQQILWLTEESFDFCSNHEVLISKGIEAIKKLTKTFKEAYQQANSKIACDIEFFFL